LFFFQAEDGIRVLTVTGVQTCALPIWSRRQVERGLVEETRRALSSGVPAAVPALTGIGYAEAVAHLRGEIPLEDLPEAMARANRSEERRVGKECTYR